MSFRQHEYIVAVATCGGFQAAANKLSINQATMSIQIKKFESAIGVEIFDRSTHPVRITEVGELIIAQAKIVLSLKMNLQKYANEHRSNKLGQH